MRRTINQSRSQSANRSRATTLGYNAQLNQHSSRTSFHLLFNKTCLPFTTTPTRARNSGIIYLARPTGEKFRESLIESANGSSDSGVARGKRAQTVNVKELILSIQDAGPPVLAATAASATPASSLRVPGGAQSRGLVRPQPERVAHAVGGRHLRGCKCGNTLPSDNQFNARAVFALSSA